MQQYPQYNCLIPDNRRDRYDSMGKREEEPEWFSSGPISKNDTIELHGFDKIGSRDRKVSERQIKEEKHDEEVFEEEESHEEEKENTKDGKNGSKLQNIGTPEKLTARKVKQRKITKLWYNLSLVMRKPVFGVFDQVRQTGLLS